MEWNVLVLIAIVSISIIAMTLLIIMGIKSYNKSINASHDKVSDRDILLFVDEQPDKIIDKKLVARTFGLSKSQVRSRLASLHQNGVLSVLYSKSMTKYSYTLSRPINKNNEIDLSQEPFMTLEDLLKIFKHYDYQVSMQELILVTGLPITVIKREMKYFENEKIIKIMLKMQNQFTYERLYMLNEPYRSNPDAFLRLENTNFELREIYEKVVGEIV
jgi:predicted DNA-binding transcriptional regulator